MSVLFWTSMFYVMAMCNDTYIRLLRLNMQKLGEFVFHAELITVVFVVLPTFLCRNRVR